MAFYQRGELQTAKTALDRAREAIAAVWPKGEAGPPQGFDWFYNYLPLQEAAKLIGSVAEPQRQSDPRTGRAEAEVRRRRSLQK